MKEISTLLQAIEGDLDPPKIRRLALRATAGISDMNAAAKLHDRLSSMLDHRLPSLPGADVLIRQNLQEIVWDIADLIRKAD
ncbi:MAG: hypothetical protein JJ864_07495 [Rhizobiaceae bacterium]|nr:hypothetical protein [Rhizobiaceae bacterium]